MKIDPKKLICGVKPARLKVLLKQDSFNTLSAMKVFELGEPEITATLVALQAAGWLKFTGTHENIDTWKIAQKGLRLLATGLHKRITPDEGRRIISSVLAETRRINTEPLYSFRVQKLILFGSMLPSRHPKTVGDVDIVLQLARRSLTSEERAMVHQAECDATPSGLNFLQSLYWPQERILLRLKQVSRYISIHSDSDLNTGTFHQEIYAFDVEQDREVTPNCSIRRRRNLNRADKTDPSENSPATAPRILTPMRPWPQAQKNAKIVGFTAEQGRLAQHLWRNGLSLSDIAKAIGVPAYFARAYLASQSLRQPTLN